MKSWSIRGLMAAGLMMGLVVGAQSVGAEEWKMEQGGIQPGQMYFGARAGAGKSTQTVGSGFTNVDATFFLTDSSRSLNTVQTIGVDVHGSSFHK